MLINYTGIEKASHSALIFGLTRESYSNTVNSFNGLIFLTLIQQELRIITMIKRILIPLDTSP